MEIKEVRLRAGMTRQEFADYFGFSRRSVEKWENSERKCAPWLYDLIVYKLEHEGLLPEIQA